MKRSFLHLVVCVAWGSAAVLAGAPVQATVITTQSYGYFAACSGNYTIASWTGGCLSNGEWWDLAANYTQTIKILSEPCNSGSCGTADTTVRTDIVYTSGRKPVTSFNQCGAKYIYELGSCAC